MFSRKYLTSKYKTYYKSMQALRDVLKGKENLKNISTILNTVKKSEHLSKSTWDNCVGGINLNNLKKINTKSLSAIQSYVDQKYNSFTTKRTHRHNVLLKQIAKACSEVQIKFTAKTNIALGSATIAAANESKLGNDVTNTGTSLADPIPEPPVIPEGTEEVVNQLNALGEATFASLGLGGNTPVGWIQTCFEYIHVGLGIPWWEAIILGTLIIRTALFPLVVIAQRNGAKMNNYLPQMQALQLKMTEARQTGNQMEAARYSQELMIFMKEKGLNPLKNMVVPLAQMPVFVSFFMALREMANTPVDSLRQGGLWWFTDLTVPDQYFLMPVITSATLWLTIELGTDSAKLSSQNLQTMKYVLRALPIVILPFTVNFPGAILCYWVSSNFISLAQVGVLKLPKVREYFNIEQLVRHQPDNLPIKPKGFTEGLKDSWTNMKITNELEERRKLDEIQFKRAGTGPIVKTYKFDPTKQADPKAIHAKKM